MEKEKKFLDVGILRKHGFVLAKVKVDKNGVVKEFLTVQLDDAPAADVVAKSEYDREVEEKEQEISYLCSLVDNLRDDISELQKKLSQTKIETAKKIFDDVEKCVIGTLEPSFIQCRDKYINTERI